MGISLKGGRRDSAKRLVLEGDVEVGCDVFCSGAWVLAPASTGILPRRSLAPLPVIASISLEFPEAMRRFGQVICIAAGFVDGVLRS